MAKAALNERQEFLEMLDRIPDTRIRYFYMMLGDAIGEFGAQARAPQLVNTSAEHVAGIAARLNAAG